MPPSECQCQKVGILVSSQLLFFRDDNTSIQVSTGTMREGGEGEDGRMTPVDNDQRNIGDPVKFTLQLAELVLELSFSFTCFT